MFTNRSFQNIVVVITCLIIVTCIVGCEKDNGGNKESSRPNHRNVSVFALDYENSDQMQILKSELFLRYIMIKQYHMGQDQPTLYYARDFFRIVLHNVMHPDTKEWSLVKIDIFMKDGSVRSEHAYKAWSVEFGMGPGKGPRPVSIEQRFLAKEAYYPTEDNEES